MHSLEGHYKINISQTIIATFTSPRGTDTIAMPFIGLRATRDVAEFGTGSDASGVAHDVSDVVLLVDTLEQVSLRAVGEDTHIISAVSFGCQRHSGWLLVGVGG